MPPAFFDWQKSFILSVEVMNRLYIRGAQNSSEQDTLSIFYIHILAIDQSGVKRYQLILQFQYEGIDKVSIYYILVNQLVVSEFSGSSWLPVKRYQPLYTLLIVRSPQDQFFPYSSFFHNLHFPFWLLFQYFSCLSTAVNTGRATFGPN